MPGPQMPGPQMPGPPVAFAPQHAHSAQQLPQAVVHRPAPPPGVAPRQTHLISTVRPPSGHGFGAMAALSLRRAFRLRIEPNEILEDERAAMTAARPPITDETQQAFLAWRRSVLFMAALLMIPVAILHAYENLKDLENVPEGWKTLTYLGIARQTPDRKYRAGAGMTVLAAQSLFASGLLRRALPALEELRHFGHTVAMGVRWRDNVSYLFHAPPNMPATDALGRSL